MIAGGAFLTIVVVLAIVAVALSLRTLVFDEARKEARLHDPSTNTVTYAVPNGIDPARIAGPLARAGFTSVVDELGLTQGIRVECRPGDRERVRRVIEAVPVNYYDGTALKVAHVVFEDER